MIAVRIGYNVLSKINDEVGREMSKNAREAAGVSLEIELKDTSTSYYSYSSRTSVYDKRYWVLKLGSTTLITADDSPESKALLTTFRDEVYDPAFREHWGNWILRESDFPWNITYFNYNKTFHDAVLATDASDRVKAFALLCQKYMNDADEAIAVAEQHVKTYASRSPRDKNELFLYLNPALAQYGEKYFSLLRASVHNPSSLENFKSEDARDFQFRLFNMTVGYDPKKHKDVLVKDWEIVDLDATAGKENRSFAYRFSGVPFQVKAFREYSMGVRVADLLEMPNVIPRNTAGRAAIKIMEDYIAGGGSTVSERLNLTVSAFQALVSRYSTDEEIAKRGFYGEIFSEVFMPMRDSENLMKLVKTYFESEESATAQYKTWDSVLHILLGLNKNKWAKSVSTADSIAGLMMKEMSEMEAINVLRSLVGEDPAIPPMTPTQWIKYLNVYKEYKDSPPSIIVSLIR